MARQCEIGIRLALGAGRQRLVRQLLTEAILLALIAGSVGFIVSRVAIWLCIGVMFATVPPAYAAYLRVIPLDVDARVLAFMLTSAIGAAIVFGLVPALQATRPNILRASRGDFDTAIRPARLRHALVVAQVTLSVILLVCAGVLLAGVRHTEQLEPGIQTRNVVQIEMSSRSRTRAADAIQHDVAVIAVAASRATPLDGPFPEVALSANGRPAERVSYNVVSPEYFSVLDLPIVSGRNFTNDEARSRASVVIVSHSTARHFWPRSNAVGQRLAIPASDPDFSHLETYHVAQVIGVTGDAMPGWIGVPRTTPTVYYPRHVNDAGNLLLARVAGDAEKVRAKLERELAAVDSGIVQEMHTLDASLALQVYPFRAMYWVAAAIGGVALLLTLIGVYGVLSYLVAQRRNELGIRLALGAAAGSLVSLVLGQSLRLALIGIGIGLAAALGISTLFARVVIIDPYSVAGYAGGAFVVLAACLAAAYVPSRRAATVNPVDALRADS
jgi:predicted permease